MFRLPRRALVAVLAVAGLLTSPLAAQHPPARDPAPAVDPPPTMLVGMGAGGGLARVLSGTDGSILATAPVFGGFTGGVRVATGDVNGDGVADLIVAPGPGAPAPPVRIFSGADGTEIVSGFPFGPAYMGGVSVAAGDLDGDGRAEVIASPDLGGLVRAFRVGLGGTSSTILAEGFPYGTTFMGGIRVAAGDVDGDGRADVITAPVSGSAIVRVYRSDATLLTSGAPYGPAFSGGVFVAAGDVNGDGRADVITAPAQGPGSVRVFDSIGPGTLYEIPAFGAGFPLGVTVAAADLDADGHAEIIAGTAQGHSTLHVFSGATGTLIGSVPAFDAGFTGGIFVAASSRSGIRFTSADTATFTTGTAGAFTVTTSAAPPVTSITMTGTLPASVAFTDHGDGTATVSGTPAPGDGGLHTVTFTAANGVAMPVAQTFTLRVEGPPVITSGDAATFSVGAAGAFTVTTTGFPAPALTATGALPAGVTFTDHGDGTATLEGTPQPGSEGIYPLTITASNGVGTAATQAFTLTVDASPAFTSAAETTFIVGTPGSFAIAATSAPPITAIALTGTLPAGVTFTDNGGGSATIGGTPDHSTGGTYLLTLTAGNGVDADAVQAFTLTVHEAPAITSANNATFTLGLDASFTVVATGTPAPTVSMTGSLPDGVTFSAATRTLQGAATVGGVFPLQFIASNGVSPDAVQPFTLTTECTTIDVTSTPATVPDGEIGVLYAGATFQQSGAASGGAWSATGLPDGLAVGAATGVLAGTPTATGVFNGTVTYTLGSCQGSANVSITIAPRAANDTYAAGLGNTQIVAAGHSSPATPHFAFAASVLDNDAGTSIAVTPVTDSATTLGGLITIGTNGSFTYTPPAGGTGSDTYLYTATSNGASAQATITLVLGPARVWYVDAAAGAGGTGRSHEPFSSLGPVNAPGGVADLDGAGDSIYVYAGTYASGFETENGQVLWGAGAVFNPVPDLSIPAGTRPTLNGTVTISGNNVTVSSIAISAGTNFGMTNTGLPTNLTVKNGVSIATTTGAAVSFSDVSASAGVAPDFGINIESVNASDPGNGIVLTNVNVPAGAGAFRVTGIGTADGSGGTISGASGPGVLLSNAKNVSLANMSVTNGETTGLRGIGATGLSLTNVVISNSGDALDEHGIFLTGLAGTSTWDGVNVTGSAEHGALIVNTSGTATLTVVDSDFQSNSTLLGESGLQFEIEGAASMTMSITGSRFSENRAHDVFVVASGTGPTDVTFTGNTLAGGHPNRLTGSGGIVLNGGGGFGGTLRYNVSNNTINRAVGSAIALVLNASSTASAQFSGQAVNNTIGTAGQTRSCSTQAHGMLIEARGLGTHTTLVEDNTIRECHDLGVRVVAGEGSSTFHMTMHDNDVQHVVDANSAEALLVTAGAATGDAGTACLDIGRAGANTLQPGPNATNPGEAFRVLQRFDVNVLLPGYGGAGGDTAAVASYIGGLNGSAPGSASTNFPSGGYFNIGFCGVPSLPAVP